MFKKLKDKIAEEVKQSPQRIQQMAQAAQAAVSSTTSSVTAPELSTGENFFSITEEDTPQNSPQRTAPAGNSTGEGTGSENTLKPTTITTSNGLSPLSMQPRQRRLSNSSMASDVSFRLPAYDSPAVYHLQSDLDCSASEFEDTASNAGGSQLDRISKEQLHSAYKKASDRYQKYRSRYTEIAARYRDLERDNNKARSVLVETQDKALRRISELREQCSLEQQAKAHFESALRLEMEEMQCVIKTLKSKLDTLGEGGGDDFLDNISAQPLVDLSSSGTEDKAVPSSDRESLEAQIKSLEEVVELYKSQIAHEQEKHEARNKEVNQLEEKVQHLNSKLNESMEEIKDLQAREEDNTILLAENKMAVHSELEAKDDEVKNLRERIQQMEALQQGQENATKSLQAKNNSLLSQVQQLETGRQSEQDELSAKVQCIESMETELLELKTHLKLKEQEITEHVSKINLMLKEHQHAINEERANLEKTSKEFTVQIEEMRVSNEKLVADNQSLRKEVQANQLVNGNSESEAMHRQHEEYEVKLKNRDDQIQELNKRIKEYEEKSEALNSEWDTLKKSIESHDEEMATVKGRIETLKAEKKEIEKALEKEVREKQELEEKERNTVQEISRLEEALKESKRLSASLGAESANFREQIADLQKHDVDGQIHKEQNDKLLEKLKQAEDSLAETTKKYETEISELTNERDSLKLASASKDEVQKRLSQILAENAQLLQDKKELEEKLSQQDEKASVGEELLAAKRELFVMKDTILGLQQQLETTSDKNSELEADVIDNKQELEVSQEKFKSLEEDKAKADAVAAQTQKELTEQTSQLLDKLKEVEDSLAVTTNKYDTELSAIKNERESLKTACENAEEIQKKLAECMAENSQLQQDKKQLEDQLAEQSANATAGEELLAAKREIFVMKDQILGLQQQLETATDKSSELDAFMNELKQELEEARDKLKSLESEKSTADAKIEELQKQLAETDYRNARAGEEVQKRKLELENELKDMDNIKVENEYLNTHVKQLEGDLQSLREDTLKREALLKEIKDKYNFAENEMSSLQEQKSKFDCLMADKNEELDQANVQLATLKQELEGVRVTNVTKVNNLTEEIKELRSEISAKQIIINDLNQVLSRLEKDLGNVKSEQSKDLDELQKINDQQQKQISELSGNNDTANEFREKNENLERLNAELRLKISELEIKLEDHVVQKSRIELEQSSKTGEMDELRDENETLKLRFQNLEKTLNSKLAVLDEKHKDLIEENRSLKDQLSKGSSEVGANWDQEKADMEERLQKIISEVQEVSSRNSFLEQKCENVLVLEQANERMKSANEKLSRQLDETLVTMHHNEGIAANTEFEYLKNIMFQYLSGSMNSNSSTLVKVISAVLKFTPQQTQVVLEKENHRHTLLGQINKML